MKEYIVVLNPNIDYNQVWNDIENTTSGLSHIPDRSVTIAKERKMFPSICEYLLTDDEANKLKNDPRVLDVEIPVRNNPDVNIKHSAIQNPYIYSGNFNKQSGNVYVDPARYDGEYGNSINWGLISHTSTINPFGTNLDGTTGLTTTSNYNYAVDGSNVDVVILDTGIQSDHPEFTNSAGVTRIQVIDWDAIAAILGLGISGFNSYSYTDTVGHGTNVAGIATGKTYGWAKNSNIIPLYAATNGVSEAEPLDTFEMLIYWHQHKGNSNPTIVNMSWDLRYGAGGFLPDIDGGNYRGTPWSGVPPQEAYGLIPLTGNGFPFQDLTTAIYWPYTSAAYNAAMQHLIDAGLVVCMASGNNGYKIDIPDIAGGTGDYDNYVTSTSLTGNIYYQRGASPKAPDAIIVGALDTLTSADGSNQKAPFSCAGPGVDVYAAGTYIMSAGCSTNTDPYFLNNSFMELNESGTSQATPQVTGVCALFLQANPTATAAQVKSWLNRTSGSNLYVTGDATSYTNDLSLLGGNVKVLYNPFNTATNSTVSGPVTMTNISINT